MVDMAIFPDTVVTQAQAVMVAEAEKASSMKILPMGRILVAKV
jgi:hypothetical protein